MNLCRVFKKSLLHKFKFEFLNPNYLRKYIFVNGQNAPKFLNIMYNFYPPIEDLTICPSPFMEYLKFPEESKAQYKLDATLLNHSKISQYYRARLFTWLSEQCSKQKISRFAFARTCSYIDLYFMKRNDIDIKKYQLLALGALILATKQAQTEGKIPIIDLKLFQAHQLLETENKIFFALNFQIQPPIYIELLNNIAKMWDMKCKTLEINSELRYFQENKECYLRLKLLYEKMDCLNLFIRILDFKLPEVVLTLFYLQTKAWDSKIPKVERKNEPSIKEAIQNPEENEQFDQKFQDFLLKCQISTKVNPKIAAIIKLLTKEKFPIDDSAPNFGKTFTQILSFQSYNKNSLDFFRKNQSEISKM